MSFNLCTESFWCPSMSSFNFNGGLFGTVHQEHDGQRINVATQLDTSALRDSLPTWFDYSGNGRDYTQALKGKQPSYVASSGLNGKPALRFSAADAQILVGNTAARNLFNGIAGATIFVVFRIGASLPATEGRFLSVMQNGNAANTLQVTSIRSNADFLGGEKSDGSQSFSQVRTGTAVVNTNYIMCGVPDAVNGDYFLYLNKTLIASNTSWQSPLGSFQSAEGSEATIGGRDFSNDRYFTGDIGHILVYNGVLGTSARNDCFDALNQWWGGIY